MPLDHALIEQAATELIARRHRGAPGPRLPESCRPQSLEDAWEIQQAVTRRLALPVGGWKASLPSPGKLTAAPIYAPTVCHGAKCTLPFALAEGAVRVEPELAFVLARDLPARPHAYTGAEVDAAVGSVHAALELCASRYLSHEEVPFAEMLADGLVNSGLWLGPALAAPEAPAFELNWQIEDEPVQTTQARHPDGHPRAPLYWLANFLRERGIALQAGQMVITGSYAGVLTLPLGRRVSFGYGPLARFDVAFSA
jgi:2-keto-4-pentenoate hydratase